MAMIVVEYKAGETKSRTTIGPVTKEQRRALREYLDKAETVRMYEIIPTLKEEREEWG